jgi:predicted nucleotide-binding protein
MIERFRGPDGDRLLREALLDQTVVQHDTAIANALASETSLHECKPGEDLMKQGGSDTHIDLILAGQVAILVGGQQVAIRGAGTHVGEMALIDPSAPRSATVRAVEPCVVARIQQAKFVDVADRFPKVWRAIARELARRLRQRAIFLRVSNETPIVFVGSSAERLAVARALQDHLHRDCTVQLWTDDVFQPSHQTVEDLIVMVRKADFAVMIMHPDDVVISRHKKAHGPRDNVVLELGMGLAVLDRDRTFFVKPVGVATKMPSDLLGLAPLEYRDDGDDSTLSARLGNVANAIRTRVKEKGPR